MRRLIPVFIALLLSSCGVIKNITKSKEKEKVKTDSSAHVKESEITNTKITELVDTTQKVKGSEIAADVSEKELAEKPFVLEDDRQVITIKRDSTGRLKVHGKVKDHDVHIKIKKTTETKQVSKKESTVKETKESEKKTKQSDKEVKRFGIPWWIWLLIILVGLVITFLKAKKV